MKKKVKRLDKNLIIVVIIAIIAILILITNSRNENIAGEASEQVTYTSSLSELQIYVCNAAQDAGTCNSRLPEVGIVLKEECCSALGKCC